MPCPVCSAPFREADFRSAIGLGFKGTWIPNFIHAARNGGVELTWRHQLLAWFEATGCFHTFTEADDRADLVLRCARCNGRWARLELKSNFSQQHRGGEIGKRRGDAIAQLLGAGDIGGEEQRRYYIHFITELRMAEGSPFGSLHNTLVRNAYKLFYEASVADEFMQSVFDTHPRQEAAVAGEEIRCEADSTAYARLWVWVYSVDADGRTTALSLPHVPS